jgi:TM2 domain-containing membrane protein YozV
MLLCFFFGTLGIHRFYMGKIITGILMLLTAGFFGIWTIFDMFTFIFSNFDDGNGQPLANKNIVLVIIFGIIYIIPIIIVTLFILGLAKLMVSAIL